MVKKFRRNAHAVTKGPRKPAAVVCRAPGWCLFNAEAREFGAIVCARRGLVTARPDAWEVWPNPDRSKLYLIPAKASEENFDYQWSRYGQRAWVNLSEIFTDFAINLPSEEAETFSVSTEQHPELDWSLVIHLNERRGSLPDELAEVDENESVDQVAAASDHLVTLPKR